jgi:hypothetical protein
MHLTLSFVPCAIFTIIVCRISMLLIEIYLNFTPNAYLCKEQVMLISKILLSVYGAVNFFSRLVVACIGSQSWMYHNDCIETLTLLSLIFSALSITMLTVLSLMIYCRVRSMMMTEVGKNMNKNLRYFVAMFVFVIACFYISLGIGKASIHTNDETK